MDVTLRTATLDDVDAIVAIYLASAEHHAALAPEAYRVPGVAALHARFRRMLEQADPADLHLVAVLDGQVVGQLDAFRDAAAGDGNMRRPRATAYIGIAVADGWRGRGIGTQLIGAAERWAVDQGIDAVSLEVAAENAGARRLYRRLGYVPATETLMKTVRPEPAAMVPGMSVEAGEGRLPVVQAATLGECWMQVSALVLRSGRDTLYDGQPIKEIERLTLSSDAVDPDDPVIARFGDPAWLAWMHRNFFDYADVPELGDAASYATRLFDYGRTGRDQVRWVIERLLADPNAKSAAITTFQPLSDTSYIPCVSLLDFWVRDEAIDLVVYAHSLDFGKKAYGNLVELALLQRMVAEGTGRPTGSLTIHVKSAHIYAPEYADMAERIRAHAAG